MSVESRRILRIIMVGALVGAIAGYLNYAFDKSVKKKVTKA